MGKWHGDRMGWSRLHFSFFLLLSLLFLCFSLTLWMSVDLSCYTLWLYNWLWAYVELVMFTGSRLWCCFPVSPVRSLWRNTQFNVTSADMCCVFCAVGWWPTGSTEPGWSKLTYRRRQTDTSSASGMLLLCLLRYTQLSFLWLTLTFANSVNGDVRFFEPRTPDSINVLQTVKGLTALDIHPQANLFAWWVCLSVCRLQPQKASVEVRCLQGHSCFSLFPTLE